MPIIIGNLTFMSNYWHFNIYGHGKISCSAELCSNCSAFGRTRWPIGLKTKQKTTTKTLNNLTSQIWVNRFEVILQKCSLGDPLPKFSNLSTLLNKVVLRAKNRRKNKTPFKQLLLPNEYADFEIISEEWT